MHLAIPSFGIGSTGGDRMIITIANNFVKRGHEVTIVNLGNKPILYPVVKKVRLVSIPFKTSKKDLTKFVISGVAKLANNLPPADVYLANWVYTVLPCIANNDLGKTVFLAQANEAYSFKPSPLKFLSGLSYEAFKLNIPLITPSRYLQIMIKKRFDNSATVVPPCVDTSIFKPRKNALKKTGPLKLLFVGDTKNRNKGFDLLLNACEKLGNIDFELHVATQTKMVLSKKFKMIVHKPTSDRELAAVYRDCDVFFHLSKEEGFGLTLLEAMASGLICVATDSGGVKDFAENEKNCFMTERTVAGVVSVIKKIAPAKEEFRSTLGQEAVKKAKEYPEKKMIDSFEKILTSL